MHPIEPTYPGSEHPQPRPHPGRDLPPPPIDDPPDDSEADRPPMREPSEGGPAKIAWM